MAKQSGVDQAIAALEARKANIELAISELKATQQAAKPKKPQPRAKTGGGPSNGE